MTEIMEKASNKGRFRFTEAFDIHLAREVYGQNPFEDPKRWAVIQVNMIQISGKCVSIRTLRERIINLVKKNRAKVEALKGRSGIEVNVTELDDLLQQISEIMTEFQSKKTVLPHTNKSSYMKGFDAREESLKCEESTSTPCTNSSENDINIDSQAYYTDTDFPQIQNSIDIINVSVSDENDEQQIIDDIVLNSKENKIAASKRKRPMAQANISTRQPTHKRRDKSIKQTTLEYLEKKQEHQLEIRNRELVLQERKQLLEEKKFEFEAIERKKKLELEERRMQMEEERFTLQLNLFGNQQKLIDLIFSKENK